MEKCQRCGNPWVIDMSKHQCKESNSYEFVQEYKSPTLDKLYKVWNEEHPSTFKYFGLIGECIQEIQALQDELKKCYAEIEDKESITIC